MLILPTNQKTKASFFKHEKTPNSSKVAGTEGWLPVVHGSGWCVPCSHEEADTRMFVHAKDAVSNGSESVIINFNDTDVVIAVYTLP